MDDLPEATDAAVDLATDNDIDLRKVTPSGANGQITKPDVEAYMKANGIEPGASGGDGGDGGDGDGDEPEQDAPAAAGPVLNRSKPVAECHGRTDSLRFIQAGNGFDNAGTYLGKVNEDNELVPIK